MKTIKDFSNRQTTSTGVPVKDVKFHPLMNIWTGKVYDEKSYMPDKWTTITWKASGKCANRSRPELDLN